MKRLYFPAAVSALALSLALAAPALAQQAAAPAQAPAPAAVPAPQAADNETGSNGQAAAADRDQRRVSGRKLMTREERRDFRRQMQAATPEQQQVLWQQKRADLDQRAAQRGVGVTELRPLPVANDGESGRSHRDRSGPGRGQEGSAFLFIVTRLPPRAP